MVYTAEMNSLIPTLFGICIIEISFFVFHRIIEKKQLLSGFISTFLLGCIVLYFSFGNAVSLLLEHLVMEDRSFTILNIGVILFNMMYGYNRGLKRIAEFNRKHGNL